MSQRTDARRLGTVDVHRAAVSASLPSSPRQELHLGAGAYTGKDNQLAISREDLDPATMLSVVVAKGASGRLSPAPRGASREGGGNTRLPL